MSAMAMLRQSAALLFIVEGIFCQHYPTEMRANEVILVLFLLLVPLCSQALDEVDRSLKASPDPTAKISNGHRPWGPLILQHWASLRQTRPNGVPSVLHCVLCGEDFDFVVTSWLPFQIPVE